MDLPEIITGPALALLGASAHFHCERCHLRPIPPDELAYWSDDEIDGCPKCGRMCNVSIIPRDYVEARPRSIAHTDTPTLDMLERMNPDERHAWNLKNLTKGKARQISNEIHIRRHGKW